MTAHEILDVQASVTETMTSLYRFWITITFGALVTAYYVGPQLGVAGFAGLVILYSIGSLNTFGTFRRIRSILVGTMSDGQEMCARMKDAPEALRAASSVPTALVKSTSYLMPTGTVAAVAYIIYRSVYVG